MKQIEKYFGFIFLATLALALFLPWGTTLLKPYVVPALMLMMFFSFIKIDIKEVVENIKKPFLISFLSLFYLFLIPVAVYYTFTLISPTLGIGLALLAAAPPAIACPALTNIVKGNTALSLSATFITHLLAPFSIVIVFYLLTATTLELDFVSILKSLLIIILIPLVISQVIKPYIKDFVKKTQHTYTAITILLIVLIVYAVLRDQKDLILSNPLENLIIVLWLYVLHIATHIIGYILPFWRKRDEKISSSVMATYKNAILVLVIAYKFFSPEIALIIVLSEIPFATLLAPFRYVLKLVKKF